jgi:hypothetical protein
MRYLFTFEFEDGVIEKVFSDLIVVPENVDPTNYPRLSCILNYVYENFNGWLYYEVASNRTEYINLKKCVRIIEVAI